MRALLAALVLLAGTAQAADAVSTRAREAIIVDYDTGNVLYGKAADEPMQPASMSKLMTVAIVLDLIEQGTITKDTPFEVSENAWRRGGSKMFVLVDTTITVENLLKGIIVDSGNDACVVVAENIAGSEDAFAKLMNVKAKEWGLEQSHFSNPTGLPDPEQLMSPHDLAKLTRRIWERYPDYHYIFGLQEFTWSKIKQTNRNPLLGMFDGALGMKTGHTEETGYGVVGLAERDGKKRILVLHGLESEAARRREADRMMTIAFTEYDTRTFFEPGDVVGEAEVFAGREETVPLMLEAEARFTLHRHSLDGAEATLVYQGPIPAPVKKGEEVGVLKLSMPDEPEREYPVYAAKSVKALSAWSKVGLGLQALLTPPEPDAFE
ncbi:serine hydrolase [Parvularcula dongshanensis]|uniref:serine-type D-Ala-D-Ala carboxypeptidase n=1 Tax=Parvularcula dongshanensis TaxID=1173995 RepID=A0A840I5Q1_9PROT|nr:D-alanyl-D-alanine carboxypeptidase (penicillin-binding protein 5/6) [Parvularcula dongshanensis]